MHDICHGGHDHGQATAHGRAMETNRTTSPARTPETQRGTSARTGSCSAYRNPVRLANRHPVGASSAGNGLRLRNDLLASIARLAHRWRMGEDLASVSERTGEGGRHRLVDCRDRQLFDAGAFWGAKTGPNPTDRGKNGTKRHLITDGAGTPLAIEHTAANVHDSNLAIPLVDAIPPIKRPRGRPRRRPEVVLADRAYDAEEKIREPLRQRGILPLIAERNTAHGSGLGQYRYVVEAAFDWLFNQRRLRVRYEKRDDIHQAFLIIGCLLICWNRVLEFC